MLAPVVQAALASLASEGREAASSLGPQRITGLLVGLALLQKQQGRHLHQHGRTPAAAGASEVHGAATAPDWQQALAGCLLSSLDRQQRAAAAAPDSCSHRSSVQRRRQFLRTAAAAARAPSDCRPLLLPGASLLQLAAALPSLPTWPPQQLTNTLARQMLGLAACGLVAPAPLKALWSRMLLSQLRGTAAGAAALASSGAALAAARQRRRRALELQLVAEAALPPGSIRRLRSRAGDRRSRRGTLLRQLAEVQQQRRWQQLGERTGADGDAGVDAGREGVPAVLSSFGGLGFGLGEDEGEGAPLVPVLSTLLEIRFARLVTNLVMPAASGRVDC